MKLPLARIEEFLSATGECELKELATGYSIDSRTIQPGDLFFAVKGERLDGHDSYIRRWNGLSRRSCGDRWPASR
jgi:UDP-N-acetylmuramoyl-tripeptide--D-alanyl-D-alanine ligase